MIGALTTAATGLEAQQDNIQRISNDLANANTDAFKRSRTEFHDLMYETIKEPGGALGAATASPVGIQKGLGVKTAATHKIFEQGPARMTYHPYDLMIEGSGFFQVQRPNGEILYTRNGSFKINPQSGRLQLTDGSFLQPEIAIPLNAVTTQVSSAGQVKVTLPGGEETDLGIIPLYRFQNEEGLQAQGSGLYKASSGSGEAVQGNPGEQGIGFLQQGALEGSNVNVANSMVDMITTQRAYEMNTKVLSAVDQMLQTTVNIK